MKFSEKLSQKSKNLFETKPITMAFLGDSVTQGCFETYTVGESGLQTVYDYEAVYHSKLKKMLHTIFPSVPINMINAGIGGGSALNGLSRLERDVLVFSPDLVVVCFGLNDVHEGLEGVEAYQIALQQIFRKLNEENIETLFMTPNMMNTNVSPHIKEDLLRNYASQFAKIQNEGILDQYINCAREVCDSENIPICDCYKKWKSLDQSGVNVTELLSNYLNHPTRDMHTLFATTLFEKLMFS